MFLQFIIAILIAFLLSFVLTPLVRNKFISAGYIEDPLTKQKKTHNATARLPVPRGGGIPIFFGVLIPLLLLLPVDKHLIGIILAALITLIVGIVDDLFDIAPRIRLLTNILAALIVVASGIGIGFISNPFGGVINLSQPQLVFNFFGTHSVWIFSDLLAIFWFVWCMNIVGWSAGVEGQLPGFVAISAIFIGVLGLKYSADAHQWPVIILSGAVAGAYLGFLPFNFFPQSIMPGYSGKSLAGFFLALLSILSGAKLATLILLLGIPMIDAIFVIFRRLIHHESIFISSGLHLHHQLLKIGWSRSAIALFYWSITLLIGIFSLFLNSQQKFYAFLGIIILFTGFTLKIFRRI